MTVICDLEVEHDGHIYAVETLSSKEPNTIKLHIPSLGAGLALARALGHGQPLQLLQQFGSLSPLDGVQVKLIYLGMTVFTLELGNKLSHSRVLGLSRLLGGLS